MIKFKAIIFSIIATTLMLSCTKDKESITPLEVKLGENFVFPEGTIYDDITADINEKFEVQLIWSKITKADVNKSWVTGPTMGESNFIRLTEEQAGEYINFLNTYLFKKLKPELTKKVFKPYYYMVYDYTVKLFASYNPTSDIFNGIDFWMICLEGKKYPLGQIIFPRTDEEIKIRVGKILVNILDKSIVNNIEIPEVFKTDFDYKTDIVYDNGYEKDKNYLLNRGFTGVISVSSWTFSANSTIGEYNAKSNFLNYMCLVAKYSKADIMAGASPSRTNGQYKDYPKILKYYDLVDKYMIEKYGFDLKQFHTL